MRLIFSLILLLQVITAEFQRPEWPEAGIFQCLVESILTNC